MVGIIGLILPIMPGWIFLTKDAINTEDDFSFWIQLALAFNDKLAG